MDRLANAIGIMPASPNEPGSRFRRALRLAPLLFAASLFLLGPLAARADPGDVGFEGPNGTGAGARPSGSKPQAKLWFNDGSWWASMWDVGTIDFYIWKLDRTTETWSRTSTRLDDRVSHARRRPVGRHQAVRRLALLQRERRLRPVAAVPLQLRRVDGCLHAWTPASRPRSTAVRSETLVIDKDSTGKLWATWEQGGRIWVNRTHGRRHGMGYARSCCPEPATVDGDDV